ncbi:hypothetical protein ACIBEA_21940 [Streptomyces sp. NPDC051555]|uniref:hypothetical protein n=1 Tax=Streptomyces sp. NPDC051555 TaxID=3365657 RepID=UPI00379B7A0D
MRNLKFRRVAGCVLLASLASLTACGSSAEDQGSQASAEARPLSAAELRTRLLPATLPYGWTSVADPADDRPQGSAPNASATASPSPSPCTDLIDGQSVVDASTGASAASARTTFSGGRSAGGGVIPGSETLYSFADNGATRAMLDLRDLVSRCRSVELPHASGEPADKAAFVVAEGPRIGDESLVVQARVTGAKGDSQRGDATVVRVGSSLVVISSVLSSTPSEGDTVAGFMPTAVAQFTSEHPEPVDAVS